MSDNVIILGAGFSKDAGIPLMADFVETMWDIAIRQNYSGKDLSPEDIEIFTNAYEVRSTLDGYHGRANFDDRNIEDILSILSFNSLAGDPNAKKLLSDVTRAIARTIELTCRVHHPGFETGKRPPICHDGPRMYRDFWRALGRWKENGKGFPTILSFNYDLVLERSFLQSAIGTPRSGPGIELKTKHVRIRSYFEYVPDPIYEVKTSYFITSEGFQETGVTLVPTLLQESDHLTEIELLKLHGSVNFPTAAMSDIKEYNIAKALDQPAILPPIFNKLSGANTAASSIWKTALERLRAAKNIIVVGYSLPRTDIYMQYFLKAALGPNVGFNRLIVYDPALLARGGEIRERYESCFAPQLKGRIVFDPPSSLEPRRESMKGTAADLIHTLLTNPERVLF